MKRSSCSGLLIVALAIAPACRQDPGTPDYSDYEDLFDSIDDGRLPRELNGPDPFVPGEQRLSLGLFYEGGFSQVVPIDGARSNYFIFLAENTLSYAQESDADRIEGQSSDRITLAGTSFWGGGIVWAPPVDLRAYDVLAVSLKSNDLEVINITVGSAGAEVSVAAADYGYVNDGEWHNLRIPLRKFADGGANLGATRLAFALGAAGGNAGAQLLVDDVYIERE